MTHRRAAEPESVRRELDLELAEPRHRVRTGIVLAALLGSILGISLAGRGEAAPAAHSPTVSRSPGPWTHGFGGSLVQWEAGGAAARGDWTLRHPLFPALPLASGSYVAVTDGPAVGGLIALPGGDAHRVTTDRTGALRVRTGRLARPRPLERTDDAATPPPELDAALVARLPASTRSVAVLYTVSALHAMGGDVERLEEGVRLALSHANSSYADRGLRLLFKLDEIAMAPADEGRDSLEQLCRDLADSGSPRFGAQGAALRARTRADHICLVTGRSRTNRDHGYALVPQDAEQLADGRCAFSVVRVGELRAGDPTLAHELSHNLGWSHADHCD